MSKCMSIYLQVEILFHHYFIPTSSCYWHIYCHWRDRECASRLLCSFISVSYSVLKQLLEDTHLHQSHLQSLREHQSLKLNLFTPLTQGESIYSYPGIHTLTPTQLNTPNVPSFTHTNMYNPYWCLECACAKSGSNQIRSAADNAKLTKSIHT